MGSQRGGGIGLAVAVVVIAASVWFTSLYQHNTVVDAFRQSQHGNEMLTAMIDQETGLRGFALTGREEFLGPLHNGRRAFGAALADTRRSTPQADRQVSAELDRSEQNARQWSREADRAIALVRRHGAQRVSIVAMTRRKRMMDAFRASDARLETLLDSRRASQLAHSEQTSVIVILMLSALFGLAGYLLVSRRARVGAAHDRAERGYRKTQAHFADTTQIVDSEAEAHDLVRRHLEHSLPGAGVIVLRRNNSADRLQAVTDIRADSPIIQGLVDAVPRSCLAVRLGQRFEAAHDDDLTLIACAVCASSPGRTTCTPLVVSGEVIGSVLVEHAEPLKELERQRVTQSVAQVAPVIANMRNLAMAEQRAATDALTGLPNRRAVHDTLKRMLAQSSRAVAPMSVLAIDLDHFKQINDGYGHGRGDEVLAGAAAAIESAIRTSDFAGRIGGEEFVVFAPATTPDDAQVLGEKLREAIEEITVPGVERAITASVGIAGYPNDAVDAETILRMADRALYSAKDRGRNRVEIAGKPDSNDPRTHTTLPLRT
jgi:diguanylate cyclase (GGDEF)-like protein